MGYAEDREDRPNQDKPATGDNLERVQSIRPKLVAAELHLAPTRERDKVVCPRHGGGSLHLYEHGAHCFGGCGPLSNVDLVMASLGYGFKESVNWLSAHFPAELQAGSSFPLPATTRGVDLALQGECLSRLMANLDLTNTGRDFLISRELDPSMARASGFRSIDANGWEDARNFLRSEFTKGQLREAGLNGFGWFSSDPDRRTAWPEPVDALVIPYRTRANQLSTIRMRRLSGEEGPKYRSLRGVKIPQDPFGADRTYPHCAGKLVHVTEGELDAWTLISAYNRLAIGAPGATAVRADWFAPLHSAAGIAIWGDGDSAGRRFTSAVTEHIKRVLGSAWFRSHLVTRINTPEDRDVNDLHQRGEIEAYLQDLEDLETGEVVK